MENQVYFLSLNRAGAHFGGSMFCPPWVDELSPLEQFQQHEEEFRVVKVTKQKIEEVRREYTFLGDRLGDYSRL